MKEIDENLLYIRNFNKITLTNICKKYNICKANIYSGKISKEKTKFIKEEIESEIAKLYLKLDREMDPCYLKSSF
jgi:hypothetical protein